MHKYLHKYVPVEIGRITCEGAQERGNSCAATAFGNLSARQMHVHYLVLLPRIVRCVASKLFSSSLVIE